MKKLTGLFLTGLLLTSQLPAQTFKSPDILVDTKLDYDWSRVMIKKIRQLLVNFNVSDPFSNRIPGALVLNESEVGNLLPADSQEFLNSFGEAVGLNILKTQTKVSLHGFSYDIQDFKTDLKAGEAQRDGLVLGTEFSASRISLKADKISFGLVIPGKNGSPVINVDIINPSLTAEDDRLINFFTQLKIKDEGSYFKFIIQKASLNQLGQNLVSRSQNIDLNYERIIIPKVSLKIGNKTVNFSPEKIERLIRDKHEAIKGVLLAQAAGVLQAKTTDATFKIVEKYKLQKEVWMPTTALRNQIIVSSLSSTRNGDNLSIMMPGDFCTHDKYNKLQGLCINNKTTQAADSRLTAALHKESLSLISDMMYRDEANIVASFSEDYINKLLVATYDAGYWTEALTEAGVTLGPNKVIMRLDKKGTSGTLIMDVVYKPSKMEKFMTGSREIRFPLVLDLSVRIEKKNGIPVVIIHLNDVDSTDQTLIYGRPQDKIVSTVKDVPRFKGKVAKAIRKKISVLRNVDLMELPYPYFKDVGLEKVELFSDGNGRMNAIMRLEDLIEDDRNY